MSLLALYIHPQFILNMPLFFVSVIPKEKLLSSTLLLLKVPVLYYCKGS